MGKNSRNNAGNHRKLRKIEKYWIEDFPEIFSEQEASDITVCISRVFLKDDYTAVNCYSATTTTTQNLKAISGIFAREPVAPSTLDDTKSHASKGEMSGEKRTTAGLSNVQSDERTLASTICESKSDNEAANSSKNAADGTSSDPFEEKREPRIYVRRLPTDIPPKTRFLKSPFKELPNGDCGDGIVNPHPKDEVPDKFWSQRKRLFIRFEDGIQLDKEAWFSVTPEAIAKHIAQRMAQSRLLGSSGLVVLDAFCGVGSNAIALAARDEVSLVICVDTDRSKLDMAAHNCHVYKVAPDKVVFIKADASRVLDAYSNGVLSSKQPAVSCTEQHEVSAEQNGYRNGGLELLPKSLDAIFLSPPWGGTGYANVGPRQYSLSMIRVNDRVDGEELLRKARASLPKGQATNVVYFLPRNTNGLSLAGSAFRCGFRGSLEMEMNVLNAKFKTITVYFGGKPIF
jgi:trimethylguanosine synthase